MNDRVIDIRADRVQRHPASHFSHVSAHLGATEAAGETNLHALGAAARRLLNRVLHGTAVRNHTAADLLADALGDQARVGFRRLDLLDAEVRPSC